MLTVAKHCPRGVREGFGPFRTVPMGHYSAPAAHVNKCNDYDYSAMVELLCQEVHVCRPEDMCSWNCSQQSITNSMHGTQHWIAIATVKSGAIC